MRSSLSGRAPRRLYCVIWYFIVALSAPRQFLLQALDQRFRFRLRGGLFIKKIEQAVHVLRARELIHLQTPVDGLEQLARVVRGELAHCRLVGVSFGALVRRRRGLAAQAGPHGGAHGIEIGPRADVPARVLLDGREAACQRMRQGAPLVHKRGLRGAEVEQQRRTAGPQVHIRRLDVEMQQVMIVQLAQPGEQRGEDRADKFFRHAAVMAFDVPAQVLAVLVIHHHVDGVVLAEEIHDAHDVGMLDLRQRPGLIEKAFHPRVEGGCRLGRQAFDGLAVDARGLLLRQVLLNDHPPAGEGVGDFHDFRFSLGRWAGAAFGVSIFRLYMSEFNRQGPGFAAAGIGLPSVPPMKSVKSQPLTASMTAFARCEAVTSWGTLTWELRSVNHRYLDIALRLPEELRSLEPRVREQIGTHLARGKVDGTLRFQPGEAAAGAIEMNAEQVQRLLAASDHLRGLAPDVPSLRAIDILRWPGVIKVPPLDVESLGAAALEALNATLDDLVKTRQREGARMQEFMLARLQSMDEEVAKAKVLFREAARLFRERLEARLKD